MSLLKENEYLLATQRALKGYFPGLSPENCTLLPASPVEEDAIPQPLYNAMGYSLLLPGKRVRPVLLLAAFHMLCPEYQEALPFACALEMIHTYSLIHDDLPAMDNDDLRRGKATNHRVFGENMAILAGDGLLNLAYETMLGAEKTQSDPVNALAAIREIAGRAGVRGMIAGQTLDVCLEGQEPREENVRYIHAHKTGDLLTAPVTAGLLLAGANREQLAAGEAFGRNLGRAFQIQDDLLDLYGDAALLGKNTGMDGNKNTWPGVFGAELSQRDVAVSFKEALQALEIFGERGAFLRKYAGELLNREY